MALFKISKGTAANLVANRPYAAEGNAYFTTDDGKFYIDISGDGTTTTAVVGSNRIPLNAAAADRLLHSLTIQLNGGVIDTGDDRNRFLYDGSTTLIVNITPAKIGAVDKSGDTMTGPLTLSGDPSSALHAVTKQYLESHASSITIRRWS